MVTGMNSLLPALIQLDLPFGSWVLGSGSCRLESSFVKRVARLDLAVLHAAAQPRHAVLRRAVGKGLRDDASLTLLLQAVIADGRRGTHALFRIARVRSEERRVGKECELRLACRDVWQNSI